MTTALLIIDIQNDYFSKGSNSLFGSDEAAMNARLILDDFRHRGFPFLTIWPQAFSSISEKPSNLISATVSY